MAPSRQSGSRARATVVPFPGLRGRGRRAAAALAPTRRSLAVGAALLVLAGAAYAGVRVTNVFAVETVRVEGGTPALAGTVRAALAGEVGRSLLEVDRAGVVARAEALPDVELATVDRHFPDTLVVSIRRELPAAVLRRGSESWLLSRRGRVLQQVPAGARPRLPRLWAPRDTAPARGALLLGAPVADALRPLRLVPDDFPVRVRGAVVEREGVVLALANGLKLRLGEARDLRLKLAVAAAVLAKLAGPRAGGPDYLDVSLPERPVAGRNPQVGASG